MYFAYFSIVLVILLNESVYPSWNLKMNCASSLK